MSDWFGVDLSGAPLQLRELGVSGGSLLGPIPALVGRLTNWVNLKLSHNQISRPSPANLRKLAGLHEERQAGIPLTQCLPPGLPVLGCEEL